MAQSKSEIQSLLAGVNTAGPRHRFGQNFMIDQNLVRLVADAGELSAADWCLEVGPGTGTLTEELLARAGRVTAVEIDRDLARLLRDRLGGRESFRLIEGDALAGKHELNADLLAQIADARSAGLVPKLVANLPYNIASPLVIELLIAGVEVLAFTVQKEVADRLRAPAGGGRLRPAVGDGAVARAGGGDADAPAAGVLAGPEDRLGPGPGPPGRPARGRRRVVRRVRPQGVHVPAEDAAEGAGPGRVRGGRRARRRGRRRDAPPGGVHPRAVRRDVEGRGPGIMNLALLAQFLPLAASQTQPFVHPVVRYRPISGVASAYGEFGLCPGWRGHPS
jgi:SAM-dependent methyltransferase